MAFILFCTLEGITNLHPDDYKLTEYQLKSPSTMKNSLLKLSASIPLLLFFLCTTQAFSQNAENPEGAYGQAPDFTLKTLDGTSLALSDFKDKIVVLHIATTWCPFCNAEAPHLEKLYQDYKEKNVAVLLIDVKEPKELVKEKLKERHKLSFPILLDPEGSVAASFAPEDVLPDLGRDEVMLASNLIIDRDGTIRFMSLLDSKNFDAELLALKRKLDELL
jgi:peroxiredoxin